MAKQSSASTPPDLSVVITIVSGADHLEDCLAALDTQEDIDTVRVEIIVPFDERDPAIARLVNHYPEVRFHPVKLLVDGPPGLCHEHFDQLRSTGLQFSRGPVIAMLEDHERPAADWCSTVLALHCGLHAAVGGAVENDIDRALNWATWFCDFGRYQNPVGDGPSGFLTDVNIAYKRDALEQVREAWENGFSEPDVHSALLKRNETLWLSQRMLVYQHRSKLALSRVLRERFVWGRYFAGNRIRGKSIPVRMSWSVATLAVPSIIVLKKTRDILRKRRLTVTFIKVLPLILLLSCWWAAGEFTGYLTGRASNTKPGTTS